MLEEKYRISKLYSTWAEVKAELGDKADVLDHHRVFTLIDVDIEECDDPECEYCADGPNEEHPGACIVMTGFHFVNVGGFYICDPPWVEDGEIEDDEIDEFTYMTATQLLKGNSEPITLSRKPTTDSDALKEVLRCVTGEQGKKLIEAHQRGEAMSERLISRPELGACRGWTKSMFKKFLPAPVAVRSYDKLALWLLSTIESIESTDAWQAASAKAARRAKRAA